MRDLSRAALWIVAIVLAAESASGQTCPSSGLTLTTTGGRLGDPFTVALSGTPGIAGVFGYDLAAGPVVVPPIGTVCLGLTPALQIWPFTLDSMGTAAFGGVLPPDPLLNGITTFMQAAAADSTQPSGFALSNGASATTRDPRLIIFSGGYFNQFSQAVPGNWKILDALTETTGSVVPLPAVGLAPMTVPALGWLLCRLTNTTSGIGTFAAYDLTSMAQVFTAPPPPGSFAEIKLRGSTLYFPDWIAQTLKAFSLPTMTQVLNAPVSCNSSSRLAVPEGPFAYVVNSLAGNTVIPVDLATSAALPPIPMNPMGTFFNNSGTLLANGFLYVAILGSQASVNGVNLATNTAILPTSAVLPGAGPLGFMRYGPGTTGPSLFVYLIGSHTLHQLSPTTLAATASPISIPSLNDMALTNGGTEWLINSGGQIKVMNPATLALSSTTLPGNYDTKFYPLPSASVNKAYLYAGSTTIYPVATDPTLAASPSVSIPSVINITSVVVD